MASIKSLAKDTAIYGLSSIIGRFLNWCLVPLYTIVFTKPEYGVVTFVYAVVALAMVILTYGMETGFFRFANHDRWRDPMQVYSTALVSLAVSGTAFFLLVLLLIGPITHWMRCDGHQSYVWMMALCVAVDAYTALPFSYLRYRKRPVRFACLRLINIGLNIGLNLFFILLCPWLMRVAPSTVDWWYVADFGVGYIFLANLISSVVTMLMLIPEMRGFRWTFCGRLWREMIAYSAPLLVLGVAGIMNQTLATLLFPSLYRQPDAMAQLGVYGANYKIAIVMVMFIQAFRFAYEPFIFAQNKDRDRSASLRSYSDAMKYFVIAAMIIFMGVMFYLDIIKYFISPAYFSGLKIVPILMLAEFFFGVHFNLSVWYKLTDHTAWGAYLSLMGLMMTVIINVLFVPQYGYMGCAWAAFGCYFTMMVINYIVGRRYLDIPYEMGRMGTYVALTAMLYVAGMYVLTTPHLWVNFVIRAALLGLYIAIVMRIEHISPRSLVRPLASKLHH